MFHKDKRPRAGKAHYTSSINMLGTILFILSGVGFLLCDAAKECPETPEIDQLPNRAEDFPPKKEDGWNLVGSLDVLDYKNQRCPNEWRSYVSKKACGRIPGQQCSSVRVNTGSRNFRQVCGRFRALQFGSPDAFAALFVPKPLTIDSTYVDGISITYNDGGRRQHVFTYAAGLMEQFNPHIYPQSTCPCAGGTQPPLFISTRDVYCESGNADKTWYPNQIFCDPLWDGKECRYDEESCCNPPHQPWFCKNLGRTVRSDLEIRLCADEGVDNEDIALESYELYVR